MHKIVPGVLLALCVWFPFLSIFAQSSTDTTSRKVSQYVEKIFPGADIPGLSLIIISGNELKITSYGYADVEQRRKVSPKTLFQLGSCSKAFTALAVTMLEEQGKLRLDTYVSDYLSWFTVKYKGHEVPITLRQLLHHTSGIPFNTIAGIPQTDSNDALEQTVRKLVGIDLSAMPGRRFEYATINYDVLALVIQTITHISFEEYVQNSIFREIGMQHTTIGHPDDRQQMALGYKIGFFAARPYEAPVFRGNNAAGYVISNAEDMSKWLRLQMGITSMDLSSSIERTHERDETVYPQQDMSSYARGWKVSLRGDGEIIHDGLNPSFTCFVGFVPGKKIGVAVLANSNSSYTNFIGENVLKLLEGEATSENIIPDDNNDRAYSIISYLLLAYCLGILTLIAILLYQAVAVKSVRYKFASPKPKAFVMSLGLLAPFLFGIYMIPKAIAGFTWEAMLIWTPVSFAAMLGLIVAAIVVSYIAYFVSLCFPNTSKFKMAAPLILLMSVLSGLANMGVVFLITSVLDFPDNLGYIFFYYILCLSLYLFGRWFVQVRLIEFNRELIYELRMELLEKIFSTTYQKFERIDRGRVYATFNDDVGTIGDSTNTIVMLITSAFTAIAAFIYLASIAFWATLITCALVISLTSVYYFVTKNTNKYFEEARDSRNIFMNLIGGIVDGFKEISIHRNKKLEYKADVAASANEFREKLSKANLKFVNASIVGESVLIGILGLVAFAFPKAFPTISNSTVLRFIIVLLYLIGPVNAILGSVPMIMRLRVAWKRVQQFIVDIPATINSKSSTQTPLNKDISFLRAEGLMFRYGDSSEPSSFSVGPIDFEVKRGEILFIIGGNGSGKTTLAKLLTGLYLPNEGRIVIDDRVVESSHLGENFSAVYNPTYLFEKLYDIQASGRYDYIDQYLELLGLDRKVKINGNEYSTINLSGGQRKRLALLQCYLEDSPIYLFDEWAADQDPQYRTFFYRTLLPEMRAAGKIVIAITHDEFYFDMADKVLKMDQGKLEVYSNKSVVSSAHASV